MLNITITGAGGFLGKALADNWLEENRLVGEKLNNIVCIGHSENETVKAMKNGATWLVGDITDKSFTDDSIKGNVILHCAAQKVIPIAEQNPSFSFKNNMLGTLNVFESAIKNKVDRVVLISTDKAHNPETIYGFSKYSCEWLCWYFNKKQSFTRFYACRYGNVAGSKMSVFEIWDKLGKEGKTLQITDPNMTRFFFTIKDAIYTVCQTLDAKLEDRPFIPTMKSITMGEALEIFCKHYKVSFEIVGNRGMEKVHEDLDEGISSENCERFTKEEFTNLLKEIGCLK